MNIKIFPACSSCDFEAAYYGYSLAEVYEQAKQDHWTISEQAQYCRYCKAIEILYTNWKGQTEERLIIPFHVHFTTTQWHLQPQWFLEAFDVRKQANRSFALKDIKEWFIDEKASQEVPQVREEIPETPE